MFFTNVLVIVWMCCALSREKVFDDEREVIKFLTNDLVIRIFVTLCTEPMNTRSLSRILGVYESIISRKLKTMEKLGLVRSKWVRIKGKNVKLYYPRTDSYNIRIGVHGVEIVYGSREIGLSKQLRAPDIQKVFVGREKELDFLRDDSKKFVFVVGLPGIGKTSLVSKYAGESGYQVVWLDILETTTLQGIVRNIAFSIEGDERKNLINTIKNGYGDTSSYIDLIIDLIRKNNVLLVLDNFHLNADPGIEMLVKKLALLENLKGKVIVISRSMPSFYVSQEKILVLKQFKPEESIELLSMHGLGREDALRIHKALNGHPYMLVLFLKEYSKNREILKDLESFPKDYLIKEILSELSYDERSILNLLCVLRKTASIKLLKRIGIESRKVKKSIEKLLSSLIIFRLSTGFQLAEIVRDVYCKDIMDTDTYHYIAARYYSTLDNDEALLEALYHYIESGKYNESIHVLSKIAELVIDNEVLLDPYMELINKIREKASNNLVKAWASFIQARYYILNGRIDEALKLLKWAETIGYNRDDYNLVLYSKIEKSLIYRYYDDYPRALRELKRANEILDTIKLRNRENIKTRIYMSLAPIYYFQGKIDKALRIYKLLLDKYIDPMDTFRIALIHGWMGLLYRTLFRFKESMDSLKQAISIFEKIGSKHSLAIAYRELALTQYMNGNVEEALNSITKSIEILESLEGMKYMVTLIGAYIDYSIYAGLLGRIDNAKKTLGRSQEYMEKQDIKIPEYTLLSTLADTIIRYREYKYETLWEDLQWIIDEIDKISYFRQIYTLVTIIPIACNSKGRKTLCRKARKKLEETTNKPAIQSKTINTEIQKTIQKITEILTSKPLI